MLILEKCEDGQLMFECPGCGCCHGIQVGAGDGPRWQWNGDMEKPTFQPSILVKFTKMTEKGHAEYEEWLKSKIMPDVGAFDHVDMVCHSFVIDGRIQFLSDCTHALAGQTVDLPEII